MTALGADVSFLLIFPVLHHLLFFDALFLFFFSSSASFPPLPPSLPLSSVSLIRPPSLTSSRPNALRISFPSLHLAPSLVLSRRPALSNPFSPCPLTQQLVFWARTSLCVWWEQVTPQVAGWPHCVTIAPTHIKFVWDAGLSPWGSFQELHGQRERARGWKWFQSGLHYTVYLLSQAVSLVMHLHWLS